MSRHRIFGTLSHSATVRLDRASMQYGVYIELAPSSTHADPIVAHIDHGIGARGHRSAIVAAKRLKHGARVYVHCLAIGLGHTASQPPRAAIRCIGTDLIEQLDRPAEHTQPAERAEEHQP